eukprot:TRINITY_DN50744_c0_g1_i2.p1 TRINITY_DN50744_c0_g1~~TRINITY_DN50744_c0_g1_i2.p1  ORF type:complete len:226 (-),score=50.65 TRINITY_DN50744_c0_g1_i2:45-722(-)
MMSRSEFMSCWSDEDEASAAAKAAAEDQSHQTAAAVAVVQTEEAEEDETHGAASKEQIAVLKGLIDGRWRLTSRCKDFDPVLKRLDLNWAIRRLLGAMEGSTVHEYVLEDYGGVPKILRSEVGSWSDTVLPAYVLDGVTENPDPPAGGKKPAGVSTAGWTEDGFYVSTRLVDQTVSEAAWDSDRVYKVAADGKSLELTIDMVHLDEIPNVARAFKETWKWEPKKK